MKKEEEEVKMEKPGNAAAMRDALENIANMGEQIDYQLGSSNETVYAFRHERSLAHSISECARTALTAPPRNCDRPECATTNAAQDVWRKEDGGKTAYYEWLLATSTKGETTCMEILNKIPDGCDYDGLVDEVTDELCDLLDSHVKAALSAPPRNCDKYTLSEALRKYGFPTKSNPWGEKEWLDFCEWYISEAKGENDGSK